MLYSHLTYCILYGYTIASYYDIDFMFKSKPCSLF